MALVCAAPPCWAGGLCSRRAGLYCAARPCFRLGAAALTRCAACWASGRHVRPSHTPTCAASPLCPAPRPCLFTAPPESLSAHNPRPVSPRPTRPHPRSLFSQGAGRRAAGGAGAGRRQAAALLRAAEPDGGAAQRHRAGGGAGPGAGPGQERAGRRGAHSGSRSFGAACADWVSRGPLPRVRWRSCQVHTLPAAGPARSSAGLAPRSRLPLLRPASPTSQVPSACNAGLPCLPRPALPAPPRLTLRCAAITLRRASALWSAR